MAWWRGDDSDGELPIHYKWTYGSEHLTRWTRQDLNEVHLEIYPAKVIFAEDEFDEVLDKARQFITFLAEEDLLDRQSDPLNVLVEHLRAIEGQFRTNMADPSLFSFGTQLWSSAGAGGCAWTTGRRSTLSLLTSMLVHWPNVTPSWVRGFRVRRRSAGSLRRARGPRRPHPNDASASADARDDELRPGRSGQ